MFVWNSNSTTLKISFYLVRFWHIYFLCDEYSRKIYIYIYIKLFDIYSWALGTSCALFNIYYLLVCRQNTNFNSEMPYSHTKIYGEAHSSIIIYELKLNYLWFHKLLFIFKRVSHHQLRSHWIKEIICYITCDKR